MPFAAEPVFSHGRCTSPRTAVLLCNLGTPDGATPAAVRQYLKAFLGDRRVVEVPRVIWWPLLHLFILRVRPKASAAKYAKIWTPAGSPLKVWSEKQATLLEGYLGERGHHVMVRAAMRYGNPSIPDVLDAMKVQGIARVLVLPLFPQYSATTTACFSDAVHAWSKRIRNLPEFRFVNRFHDDPGYIAALAKKVKAHWASHGQPEKMVLSFHGLPQRNLTLGDAYHCECMKTARLLGGQLGLAAEQLKVTFQSRLGRAQWLQPYTEPTLIALAQQGIKRVDVMCPGFTSDCLETLEEIAMEARAAFLQAGGQEFNYISCLNDQHEWMCALTDLATRHLQGWDTTTLPHKAQLLQQRERALAQGARD